MNADMISTAPVVQELSEGQAIHVKPEGNIDIVHFFSAFVKRSCDLD